MHTNIEKRAPATARANPSPTALRRNDEAERVKAAAARRHARRMRQMAKLGYAA